MATATLNSGHQIPLLAFGCWPGLTPAQPGQFGAAVKVAVENGIRHIDEAAIYGNEVEVGSALHDLFESGKVKREEMFITSKLWNSCHRKEHVRESCLKTIKDLQLNYLDLYLIHWPHPQKFTDYALTNSFHQPWDHVSLQETWGAMEALVEEGLVRSIGVSNFNVQLIRDLWTYAKIKPAVNQVELHPYLQQQRLVNECTKLGMHMTAYCPFGNGRLALDKDHYVQDLAKKYGKNPVQILLRWSLERKISVITKSLSDGHIIENCKIFDFSLTADEMMQFSKLERNSRICQPNDFLFIPLFD
eukprot:TRINITY_DN539_c0_g2_i3.p1 TRINITY_DN539_c0_g2~~TRINITY_DN539_c0_g2_i3.p1  ORF type:complete len:303 (+),score=48.36 TRINITY_DN539_c0_g2_i3:104-1012(+)